MPINRCWPRGFARTICWTSPMSMPAMPRNCFRWKCGAGRRSIRRCGSSRNDPWQRLADMREKIPNILFQMLFRASNAVGYASYPDNVVTRVLQGSGCGGHGHFPHLRLAQLGAEHAGGDGGRAEDGRRFASRPSATRATSSNPKRTKYDLKYYVELAKELEKLGAHILCDQGHGRPVQAVCGRAAGQNAEAGNRHSDSFSHARHGRHAGGLDSGSGRGRSWISPMARWPPCRAARASRT